MTRRGLTCIGIVAGLLVLAADQASKFWVMEVLRLDQTGSREVLPVLSLTFVWNRGVTFGLLNSLGPWSHVALAGVALAIVAALGAWLIRAERPLVAVSIGAIAGGAIGNVIDRLRFGAVADFIHAHAWGWSWYVFNVADASIVCGVAVLVFDSLLRRDTAPANPDNRSRLADAADSS